MSDMVIVFIAHFEGCCWVGIDGASGAMIRVTAVEIDGVPMMHLSFKGGEDA
jgi:hypothetical protein